MRSDRLRHLCDKLREFTREQQGATAVEYAVMLALVLMVVVGAVSLLGTAVRDVYATINEADW